MAKYLEKEEELYFLIIELIKEKKVVYLKYVLKMIPKSVNTCNKECSLLYWIINEYLSSIKKRTKEDILYYKQISNFILFQKKLNISKKEQERIVQCLNRFLEISGKKITREEKENLELLRIEIKDLTAKKGKKKNKNSQEIIKNFECGTGLESFCSKNLKLNQKSKGGIAIYKVEDYTITIDCKNTSMREDALSCHKLKDGSYILGVHIVSVLEYMPYDSNEMQDALAKDKISNITKNGEALFSKKISNQISLEKNQERYTRSYYFTIDSSGKIINESFQRTITMCDDTLSYEEADEILKDEKRPKQKRTKEVLKDLNEVYNLVASKYFKNKFTKATNSSQIVEFAAMLTGNRVAHYFADRNYPCLYLMDNWDELEQHKELESIYQKLQDYFDSHLPPMDSIKLGVKYLPIINYGKKELASNLHCQCTSPLRNESSIFIEYLLQQLYDKEPTEGNIRKVEKEAKKKALQFTINKVVAPQKK